MYKLIIKPINTDIPELLHSNLTLDISILDCDDSMIHKRDNEGRLSCETPLCTPDCNLSKNFQCIKGNDDINEPKLNNCKCIGGYKGVNCDVLDYYDFE